MLLRGLRFLATLALVFAAAAPMANAQISRGQIPSLEYWITRDTYYDGDFASARRQYQDAARGAITSPEGRWVDSICYHTMIGESHRELGALSEALDQYSSAIKLYLAHQNWMLSVEFPQNINEATNTPPITWGKPTRATRIGKYPEKYPLILQTLTPVGTPKNGIAPGLMPGKEALPINAAEIARCLALCIRRRHEIMGPTCERDRLTDQLVVALQRRPAPPNNWSQAWVSVQLGLAQASAGKDTQALSELNKGLQAGGTFDHALTSLALLAMGDIFFRQGKYNEAGVYYLEATYSAAMFDQYDDMEDGFRGAQLCWLISGKNAAFQPLASATAWAGKTEVRTLEVALRLLAAENLTFLGDNSGAATLLSQAQKAMHRREMQAAEAGARWNFEMARVAFAGGNLNDGGGHLAAALKFQQASSPWLFQIGLADTLVTSGGVTEREADLLYAEVLRDPTPTDWATDPLESLTVSSTSFLGALEHWFAIALARKEPEKAMEIADRIRRHRFYATLPLGGRLLALRWIMESPADMLDEQGQLQRQDLLLKYPKYGDLSKQAGKIKDQLADLPILSEDEQGRKQQVDLLGQLGKLSAIQEVMLRNIALRREGSDYAFPPTLKVKELQPQIPARTLVLSYINVGGKLFAFALSKDKYASFAVDVTPRVKAELGTILKAWGNAERNQTVDVKDLVNDEWRPAARRLLKTLTNNMKDENWASFDELVIVPDSVLWYLPFEALPLSDDSDAPPLISRIRVRYVPTMALARPDATPKTPLNRTAVVAGKLFPRDDVDLAAGEFEKIRDVLPDAARLMSNLPAASPLFASQLDQLIVFHDLEENGRGAYDWSPCPVDKLKSGTSLAEWFALPWEGPKQVILPGFHTPAEASFRRGGTGEELFLTSCAFLASGSKTVLLSRWRTAGQTSFDLAREFALESPYTSASAAWQRSVQLAMHSPLDPAHHPRLQASDALDGMTTSHPFFWAGYLVVDTGAEPKSDKPAPPPKEDVPEKKPAEEKPPEKPAAKKPVEKDEAAKDEAKEPAKPRPAKKPAAGKEEKAPAMPLDEVDEVDEGGVIPPIDLEAPLDEEKPPAKGKGHAAKDARPREKGKAPKAKAEPLVPRAGKKR